MKTETTTWSKFINGGKATAEQILYGEKTKLNPRAGFRESQSGICVGKLKFWEKPFEHKNYNRVGKVF